MSDPMIDAELARTCWDDAALAWDDFVEHGDYYRSELHGPALLDACGDLAGRDVLDLGCGQGWFTRRLAGRGARVTGVDWSPRLIERARRYEADAPQGARYAVLDAAQVDAHFAPASFDLVTGCMSLMDMPAPGAALAAARALVRPGGRIVMSVTHPVTEATYRAWERDAQGRKLSLRIDRYFEAGTTLVDWNMARVATPFRTVVYRKTLEQWSALIEEAGLVITRLREPRPDAETIARRIELADAARVPFFLLFELRAAA
jgi:2-polyprenyl-3-methyl-5-hydroxy-6-metoxy-1,4-benzoquinol methylase